ncbi:putative zinc-finger of transcription factor IIIC complex-domain-containing protein [Favolaschia claudopus]|uniref:Zinc-finger of transcription factor IIIC complex-domain-containing protein n=1 Tax=Favolaschia claudopus TaxID=2862362 RepID=A0AAW0DJY1_9AGAR
MPANTFCCPIYTSLTVPVVACVPSATAFQWSADGQAYHGLNFEPTTAIKAVPGKQDGVEPIGWYRTLIQFDRAVEYLWPEHSQDWSAISLGSVDIALWAVTLVSEQYICRSRVHLKCIVAALTSSMDVFDITPFLLNHFSEESNAVRSTKITDIIRRKRYILVPRQADFGLTPTPLLNGSLLVAGNRAGMLMFFRPLNAPHLRPPFGLDLFIRLEIDNAPHEVCPADQRPCTALQWVEISGSLILVYHKVGVIYLWRPSKHGRRMVRLARFADALVLCLFDGSFHVVHKRSQTNPSWIPTDPEDDISTQKLSLTARSIFTRAEVGPVDAELENRVSGMTSYDGSATVTWVHDYKHDSKHNSIFLVARLWDDTNDEGLLQNLSDILQNCRCSSGFSPAHLLRPIFYNLHPKKLNQLLPRVLNILAPDIVDHSTNINIEPWTGELTPEMRKEFRDSLARHLYGFDVMLSLRMRLSLADFAWKKRDHCGQTAQTLLNAVSHRVLRTIIRHVQAVVPCIKRKFSPNDVPFVLRLVIQAFLSNSPDDLKSDGQRLTDALHNTDLVESVQDTGLNEACPACGEDVPLQTITNGVCPRGHSWTRCSISTFILSTPRVQTCVGCSRKAFLPPSRRDASTTEEWLPEAGRGWIVEELLEAVHRCLFCGNSFVSML